MDLDSNVLDSEFIEVVNELFGVDTLNYDPRFEILVPCVDETGKRLAYGNDPERIITSNIARRVSRREPASTSEGIHSWIDHRDRRQNRHSDMRFSPTRRSFLEAVNNVMPSLEFQQMRALSDAGKTVDRVVDISEGVVIDGRGPSNPIFFKFRVPYEIGEERCKHEEAVIPYFHIDGRDTSEYSLNLYRTGDSLVLVGDYGGFFPAMSYVGEVQEALGIELPGQTKSGSELGNTRVIRDKGMVSLLHRKNAKDDRNFATRLIVGDGEVRLMPGDEQTYSVTVKGRHVAELSFRYNLTTYGADHYPDGRKQGLTPSQIRAEGFGCCFGELQLTRIVNQTDEEWAGSLADYFGLVMPGMSVEQRGSSVHLSFEPFGIDCTLGRKTTNGQAWYQVNGKGVEKDRIGLGKLLNYVFERHIE